MFFITIGILALIVGSILSRSNPKLEGAGRVTRIIATTLILLGLASSCIVQIQAGQVGVKSLFGKIQEGILTEGLNVMNPIIDVRRFDARTQNYTMSAVHDEGDQEGDDAIRVLSSDGLEVSIDMTILYKIIPDRAPEILRNLGIDYKEVVVRPITRTKIRDFAAYYDAVSLYSTKRDEFQQRLSKAIEDEFKNRGLLLEQVLVRNIDLPESVKTAIEAKINAEQESQKMRFILDKERQEADRKRVEAQGIADYQRILTSSLTDKLIQYEQIKAQKELAASPNAKIVIMNGKSSPLLLNGN